MRNLYLLAAFAAVVANAQAQDDGSHHRGPPKAFMEAALKACEGKSEGDAVSLTGPEGESLDATCALNREGQLAAKPPRPPKGGERRPRPDKAPDQ